jgi:hypothetical protein
LGLTTIRVQNLEVAQGWNPYESQQWRIATSENFAFTSLDHLDIDYFRTLELGSLTLSSSLDGSDLFLNYTAVPESSTLVLIGMGGPAILLIRRRRSTTA